MNQTHTLDWGIMRRTVALAAIALLAGSGVQASARGLPAYAAPPASLALPGAASLGESIATSRGPAFVTGNFGSMSTVGIPGSGGPGFLINNGNGTSTLSGPGVVPQTVINPR